MYNHEKYYCLSSDSLLYALGDHGDFEAAEATAKDLHLDPVWIFGEESFQSWRDSLNNAYESGE